MARTAPAMAFWQFCTQVAEESTEAQKLTISSNKKLN